MTILDSVRTFIMGYAGLESGAPLWVDFLGNTVNQYSIDTLPGERTLEWYIDDSSLRVFPFAFQSMRSTADELERLANNNFFELFADWLESQWRAGTMPTLETGKQSYKIEATGWGSLQNQGESETGIYQIQCRLIYKQDNPT